MTYTPTKIRIDKRTGKPTPESLQWSRAQAWYDAVRGALVPVKPADAPWRGPINVTIDVYFERTQELLKPKYPDGPIRHICKPDRDNTDKSILDALTEAGLWLDDAQVCDGPVRKWWAARGAGPGVIIAVQRIGWTEPDAPCTLEQAAALDKVWLKPKGEKPAKAKKPKAKELFDVKA